MLKYMLKYMLYKLYALYFYAKKYKEYIKNFKICSCNYKIEIPYIFINSSIYRKITNKLKQNGPTYGLTNGPTNGPLQQWSANELSRRGL